MSQPAKPSASKPSIINQGNLIVIIVVAVLVIAGVAVAVKSESPGTVSYGCLSVSQHGNTLTLSTSGLIHIESSGYYISCAEGANLPTAATSVSCLSITPKQTTSPYPSGQTTYLYYLTAPKGAITVEGASANSTEILQPTTATLSINCG